MKEALLELFKLLIQLGRLSTDDPQSVEKLKNKIALQKDVIDTMHGDSDFNDLEVVEALDDLTEILATSTPDPQYEEIPDDLDDTSSIEAAGGDGVEGETQEAKTKSTAAATKYNPEAETEAEDTEEEEAPKKKTKKTKY